MAEGSVTQTSSLAAGVIGAVIGAIAAIVGSIATIATGYLTFASKDQELRVHLVEIAIGILRADPKEDVTPARGWAIDVIEQKSGVPFSSEDRAALLHKPILDKVNVIGLTNLDSVTNDPILKNRLEELARGMVTPESKVPK